MTLTILGCEVMVGCVPCTGTWDGVNAILGTARFLLLMDGQNLGQSFVKAGGMFPIYCLLAGFENSQVLFFKVMSV